MNLPGEVEKMHHHIYSKRKPLPELLSRIGEAGFRIDRVIEDEFKLTFTDGTTMFNHFLIRLGFIDSWKEIVPEHKRKKAFSAIEHELNAIAAGQGQLDLTIPFAVIDCEKISA